MTRRLWFLIIMVAVVLHRPCVAQVPSAPLMEPEAGSCGRYVVTEHDLAPPGVWAQPDFLQWEYRSGDDIAWADPAVSDSGWQCVSVPESWLGGLRESWTGRGWYRLHLLIDSSLIGRRLALVQLEQYGAWEVYLNGRLAGSLGRLADDSTDEEAMWPADIRDSHRRHGEIAELDGCRADVEPSDGPDGSGGQSAHADHDDPRCRLGDGVHVQQGEPDQRDEVEFHVAGGHVRLRAFADLLLQPLEPPRRQVSAVCAVRAQLRGNCLPAV